MLTEHTVMKHPMAVQKCWVTECGYLMEGINNCYIAHPFPCNYLDRRLRGLKEKEKGNKKTVHNMIVCFFEHV